jgi:hypothetical protein
MLAYVFWHWRRPQISAAAYESLQCRFHEALAAAPPAGFLRSSCLAIAGAAWAAGGGEAYEDWYLVEGSAALDPLNAAAITASRQAPHDAAAGAAGGGTAGLYRLRLGELDGPPRSATWFTKPEGMSYGELFGTLEPTVQAGASALWGRQMTLGPAPEFCLHTASEPSLPAPFLPTTLLCRPVWPPLA